MRIIKYFLILLLLTAATVLGERAVRSGFTRVTVPRATADESILNDVGKKQYPKGSYSEVSVSILSQKDAIQLFRSFAENKEIAFRYPIDGCYARATEMAEIAEKQKIKMAKIFAEGLLVAKTNYEELDEILWGWHVAPVVYVKLPNGKVELQVFDPSLFDRPVPVEEWKQRMLAQPWASIDDVYMGSRFQYWPNGFETEKRKWVREDVRNAEETMRTYLPLQLHPIEKKETPAMPESGAR